MIKQLPSFADAQKAIKGGKDPRAFLHLGLLYAQGIGTTQDEMLAQYFIKKALDMGCQEAEECLELEYESGIKDFGDEINAFIGDANDVSRETIAKLKVRVEKERIAGNIGNLFQLGASFFSQMSLCFFDTGHIVSGVRLHHFELEAVIACQLGDVLYCDLSVADLHILHRTAEVVLIGS
jgi:TPR repeat protein